MALTWNPFGALGVLTGLMVAALAFLVYATRPDRSQNRRLALFLGLEAVIAVTGTGLMFLSTTPGEAYGWQAPTVLALLAMTPIYLRFIATLETPLARPLRHRLADRVLIGLALVLPLAWFAAPSYFVDGMVDVWFVPWELVPGPGWLVIMGVSSVLFLYGALAAFTAYLLAPRGTAARTQAGMYAIAFGFRDLSWATFMVGPIFIPGLTYDTTWGGLFWATGPPVVQLVFVPLLAYAILKHQLFGIDLKIKAGIQRSTVVAVFAVAFLVVSEGVERVLNVEGLLFGLLAAVAIGLLFRRVERLGEAVADRLMPDVEDTPAYRRSRKLDIYRAALEGAVEDGEVTDKERTILARLRDNLGIEDDDAERLEADVVAGSADGAGIR